MIFDGRDGARSPAFISGLKFFPAPNGKCRDKVLSEGRGVIVKNKDNDIRFVFWLVNPLFRPFIACEDRLEIRVFLFALVNPYANKRDMTGGYTCCNFSHSIFRP